MGFMLKPVQKFALVSRIVMTLFIGGSLFMSYIGLTQVTENAYAATVFTVNSTGDAVDASVGDSVCATAGAVCTLRAAIQEANAFAGADIINFAITPLDGGVKTIAIASSLPSITQTVTINGFTQNGASVNTISFPNPLDSSLKIEIDGSGMGSGGAFDIQGDGADDTIIKGLIINDIPYESIYITDSDNVTITGNYIGTDSTGLIDDGGGGHGVRMSGTATGTMIGGSSPADRNTISGNGNAGVLFYGAGVSGNSIQGNYIGLGVDGSTGIGNSNCGICSANGANTNTIGGDGAGEGNIISSNGVGAIYFAGSGGSNVIQGNYMGTDYLGTSVRGNNNFGITIDENDNNTIGGSNAGARNIISGNSGAGLSLTGGSNSNTVSGNYIGLGSDGSTVIGNGSGGVYIENPSSNNTIGGTTSDARNIISGNSDSGVVIAGSTANTNVVSGNYIGTDSTGAIDKGNATYGIVLDNSSSNTVGGTTGVTVGGNCTGACNVISGNGADGIWFYGDFADSNNIKGNYIGTDVSGNIGLGNSNSGINITNSSDSNLIGGSTAAERNIISDNDYHGIGMYSSANALNNVISGNYIGTGADGTTDLGNAWEGVYANDHVQSTLIGGTTNGQANLIKNNGGGVAVVDATATNNAIIGNRLYRNDNTAIDLQGNGISDPNDAGDTDTGGNDLLNKPEWSTFTETGGDTDVEYTLDVPAGDYRVETFSNNGKTLIDTQNITHTGSGSESFSNTITGEGYSAVRMTATEIDGGLSSGFGSTSEYSEAHSSNTSTIMVNSIADDEDDDGECTFREAITASNDDTESGDEDGECVAGAATDTIEFSIAGSGVHTIQPDDALPAIEDSGLTINGYSQTGAVENSGDYSTCFEGTIKIEIDGSNAANDDDGLVIAADNVTVRGLAINRFPGSGGEGILIASGSGSTVAGNILGLDTDGLVDRGNGAHGVYVHSAAGDVTIGGATPADRNLISGNDSYGGISISSDSGTNTIIGNCIGTDATGASAVANAHEGINFYQSSAINRVGGTTAGERNIISGNTQQGINLNDSSVESIRGNYIGTNVTGSANLANGSDGIGSNADSSVGTIGGTSSGARNVISGNEGSGIYVLSASTIQGNYIGLDVTGSVGLGNTSSGIKASGAGTVVGGASPGAGNVVSDNGDGGILADAAGDIVQGNLVGTSADGLSPLGNVSFGIEAAENDVIVGGDTASERNVVAASITGGNFSGSGIVVLSFGSGRTGAIIQGNYIGTNINGAVGGGFGNAGWGVFVIGDYKEALIGGTGSGEGNKIVSSGFDGIGVYSFIPFNLLTTDNTIIGNSIYQNGSTGIRLMADTDGNFAPDTPTPFPNDDGLGEDDADEGPNDFLNHPVLNSSSATTGSLDVNFDLDVPDINPGVTGYRVEFFANNAGDASGNGEGQIYLGHADVSGDVANHIETISLDPGVITTGTYDISATVTEIDGSTNGFSGTSEFSNFLDNKSVIQPDDNDGDGVNDAVEDAGPNGGDGNDDGTIDSEQTDVATILDVSGDNYLTLALEDGGACDAIVDFESTSETDQATLDPNYDYPYGMNSFTIPCADSVDALLYYHGHTYDELLPSTPRKFGPTTPGDSSTNAWYSKFGLVGGFEVNGVPTAVMEIALTDGAQGDDTANDNVIVDDNGLGVPVENSGAIGNIISALASTGFNERLVIAGGAILFGIGSFLMINKRLRAGK